MANNITLSRNAFGHLVATLADGSVHESVTPVRAFPIAAPDEGFSLTGSDGHEVAWIDRLDQLDAASRVLIEEELASREFMPQIRHIRHVSTFATPSQWQVETDRGEFSFTLKGEEDIRRVGGDTLLIADSHGVQFLIRHRLQMDRHSRRILDRFL
ncbi:MAG: DUF1854 domain-containing protein [Rhodocyclaceae bacterium]